MTQLPYLNSPPTAIVNYAPQGRTLRDFQLAIEDPKNHHAVIVGPLGSGKTQACLAACLWLIDSAPTAIELTTDIRGEQRDIPVRRSRGIIARNTFTELYATTIKDFRAWTDDLGIGHFTNGSGGQSPSWSCEYFKADGSKVIAEIMFLAFDVEQDMRRARGLQCSWVYANEIKELRFSLISLLFSRTGRYPARSRQLLFGDTNAPDRDHWVAELALVKRPGGWWFGIQPGGVTMEGGRWVANPAAENIKNLPVNYYANQISGAVSDSYIRQNLANEFVHHSDGRPVHPDFSEQLHVAATFATPGYELVCGVDFGRTPACTIGQNIDGRWFILEEIVSFNSSALPFGREIVHRLNAKYAGYTVRVFCDPAGDAMSQTRDETPIEMLQVAGLTNAEAAPGHNDFLERTTALDEKLRHLVGGQPAIVIDPSCSTLIGGLAGSYQFKRVQIAGGDRYQDKPDKTAASHVCESLHYALLGGGEAVSLFNMDDAAFDDIDEWHPPHSYFG